MPRDHRKTSFQVGRVI